MELKRFLILQFLIVLITPMAFAEISINLPDKNAYNLGDKISPSISVKVDEEYNGFFNLRLICDDYDMQYFTSPLYLEKGVRTQVDVPDLTLFGSMIGTCRIKAGFDSSAGAKIDTSSSNDFLVTDKLNINVVDNLEAKPGENVNILADVLKQSNEFLSKGNAEINLMNTKHEIKVISGKLDYDINLENDVEPGNVPIIINVRDDAGNFGEINLNLKILQIPSRIENQIEDGILIPGNNFKAKIILYDHKSNIIEGAIVNVKVLDSNKNLIAENEVESLNYFVFVVDNFLEPGVYSLLSAFEDVKEQSTFVIESYKKIEMKVEGNFVHVRNIGNIEYKDKISIILKDEGKSYIVNRKISLKPQETTTIDLSKEVPSGVYDIILPIDSVADNETNLINDVSILDNRNLLKKTTDGLLGITGATVSTAKFIASRPTLASIILITIILGIVTYYSRGFIRSKIKGKKPNDTSSLFDDFDYKKKE